MGRLRRPTGRTLRAPQCPYRSAACRAAPATRGLPAGTPPGAAAARSAATSAGSSSAETRGPRSIGRKVAEQRPGRREALRVERVEVAARVAAERDQLRGTELR